MHEASEQIPYHVQMYVYRQMPVSLDQISFALFTCSMSLKGAWVHIYTEICTDGMQEIMSVGTRLSTFVFRRYY